MLNVSDVITFIVELLLAGLIVYAIYWFLGILNLPGQIKNIVMIIIGVIALLWLLKLLGLWGGTI